MKIGLAGAGSTLHPSYVKREKEEESSSLFSGILEGVKGVVSVGDTLLKQFVPGAAQLLGDPKSEQFERMWEMQRENQSFNMEYLELQSAMQEDNRRYSTLSNLMKARHDTAKSAINNMHV